MVYNEIKQRKKLRTDAICKFLLLFPEIKCLIEIFWEGNFQSKGNLNPTGIIVFHVFCLTAFQRDWTRMCFISWFIISLGVWAGCFLALKNYCLALFSLGVTPSNLKAVLFTNELLISSNNFEILFWKTVRNYVINFRKYTGVIRILLPLLFSLIHFHQLYVVRFANLSSLIKVLSCFVFLSLVSKCKSKARRENVTI